jgi:hypothetical protein
MKYLLFICSFFPLALAAQDIEGTWTGSFVQYIHNVYDVEMKIEKLPPGNTFSARLRITNGFYFGEYQISGYICERHNLEISTIILVKENENGSWVDCLNGTWDLNNDENELTFTDTWIQKNAKNNTCKVKYLQRDMFQCLRSSYLRKAKYSDALAEFDKLWSRQFEQKEKTGRPQTPALRNETSIVAKNEDRAPVIDTLPEIKMRPVVVKDEIEVSSADITVEYWDRYTEDGDSINIYINKKPVLENARLTKIKQTLSLHLDQGSNYLVVHALNLGSEPPNTASITVKDGKKIQNVSLTSNLRTSGGLKITVKKQR